MTDKGSQASRDRMERLTVVTLSDFEAVDFEAPIQDSKSVNCMKLASKFQCAAREQETAGNPVAFKVYSRLGEILLIHLNPFDQSEPFTPIYKTNKQRSMIPSDLAGENSQALTEIAPDIKNHALRARLSDIAWQNNKKCADLSRLAIHSYCEAVEIAVNEQRVFSVNEKITEARIVCDLLRRACQIAQAIGWKDPEGAGLKSTVQRTLQSAFDSQNYEGFNGIGILCLDWGINSAVSIGEMAEALASVGDMYLQVKRELWELAARGYHLSGKESDNYRCRKFAAECFVKLARDAGGKGVVAASFISDAIEAYRKIPETKERREELQKLLREAQTGKRDEMQTITRKVDLTSFVEDAQRLVAGKLLSTALENFADLTRSPDRSFLQYGVKKLAEENPLWAAVPFNRIDNAGKVVARSPGLFGGGEDHDEAMRHRIAENEAFRRGCAVYGLIEPARRVIHSEHSLDQCYFLRIAEMSSFVPDDRVDVFALGFFRFFQGDFISAVHILVPQLENSVRHILSLAEQDTSTILSDMTEESRSLPSMLNKCREELEGILGSAIVFDMDNVFVFEGGPKIRHSIAHGLISGADCYSADVIYACWFIYRLCCLPLLGDWAKVAKYLDEIAN